jgi:hypothetical protein
VVIRVAAIGIAGTRSATRLGNEIASDELTTSTATGQLARIMDRAYATGEAAFLAPGPAERSRLLGFLYSSLLPAADARLYSLERLHADDPPAERAGLERLVRQWAAVRDLLSPTSLAAQPAATLAARLAAAYQPVSSHLDRLLLNEQHAGRIDRVEASASQAQTMGFIVGAAVLGIGAALSCCGPGSAASAAAWSPARIRPSSLTPCRSRTTRTRRTSCSSATWNARSRRPPRSCSTGTTAQIRDSVGQAAPVLANLRNLAVAEIRAATDGLTGLPTSVRSRTR